MPLPQKIIEQLGREPARTPGWAGRLLMFASTIFFITLAIYIGLAFGYKPYLEGRVQKLSDRTQALNQEVTVDDKENILVFYSQLTNLKKLLGNHIVASRIFEWLEQNTHADVTIKSMDFKRDGQALKLIASAKSIEAFIEQVQKIQQDPEVKKVSFGNVEFGDRGQWNFDLAIVFDPPFLTNPQVAAPAAEVPLEGGESAPVETESSTSNP